MKPKFWFITAVICAFSSAWGATLQFKDGQVVVNGTSLPYNGSLHAMLHSNDGGGTDANKLNYIEIGADGSGNVFQTLFQFDVAGLATPSATVNSASVTLHLDWMNGGYSGSQFNDSIWLGATLPFNATAGWTHPDNPATSAPAGGAILTGLASNYYWSPAPAGDVSFSGNWAAFLQTNNFNPSAGKVSLVGYLQWSPAWNSIAGFSNPRLDMSVTLTAGPAIVTQPLILPSGTGSLGGSVTQTVVAVTDASATFAWFKDGAAITSGANPNAVITSSSGRYDSTLVLNNLSAGDAGRYWVVATDSRGSTASVTNQLTVTMPSYAFDTFGDGFWTVVNVGNGNPLVVNNAGASQAAAGTTPFQKQFEVLYNIGDSTFRLRNHDSWLCIGALNGATTNGTPVVTVATYTAAASQRWGLVPVGSSRYRIVNAASGLALQTDNGSPAKVTLAPVSTSAYQYWTFAFQTHYPKKGLAGNDGQMGRFNSSWLYNWGWGTSQGLTAAQAFAPMQWGNWGIGALSSVTEKPLAVLGFNEPDHTDQANMTTDQAIALWPSLQALNLPLVSPACANDFGGWLAAFYNQIAAHSYRVDYTAYHWYANPSASGLLSALKSAYTTWGRPVWLTEFSPVDWGGTATWTEQDNYRFLAEFLWQTEDPANEWLKRYSLFFFGGTPSANPWDGNGHRGDTFLPDFYTLTPYGELYASWDADLTVRTNTPYFIHNCATCFRLTSARNLGAPAASSIRHGDATTQWSLTAAPTGYYVQSLADGRRLRGSSGVLDLAPPGTTGTAVQWGFGAPDGNGYYLVTNSAGVTLSGSGSGGGISFGLAGAGTVSDNTRWRLVKPNTAVPLAAVVPPTNLTAWAANRSATLRWSGGAPRYHVYRAAAAGGPYTRIAADIKWSAYTDNTALNGLTYYYVVTAVDGLENESAYSSQVSAAPQNGLNPGLVAEYKFENGAQDSSGWGAHGLINGFTTTVAGRVDASAISFPGGDGSFVEIPNPLGNDFSISFWMSTTSTAGTGQWWAGNGLVDGEVPGATNDFGVALVGGAIGFGVGNPDVTITSSSTVNDGNWHHVVATRNGTTGTLQLYVDGVLQASGSGAATTRSTPVSLHIGNLQSGNNCFAGAIDEVRLYNYVVSPATVGQLYGCGSTLMAWYPLDGNLQDTSGFGNLGRPNGTVTFVPGKAGSLAAQFDGASASVTIPVPVATDFSLAYWVKTAATGGAGQWWAGSGMVDGEVPGSAADFGTALVGAKAAFGMGNPDTTITSSALINDGQWHHVAATRNSASGAMRLYVDGALQAAANGPTNTRSAPPSLSLGSLRSGNGFFAGALDEVRFYNYQLSASQIAALVTPQPLPGGWVSIDLGAPASPGYANFATNTGSWNLGGGGADFGGTADQCQFASTNFSGAGSLVARLTSPAVLSDGATLTNSKVGLVFRDSLAAGAPFVALVHAQGQGLQLLYRDASGAATVQQGGNLYLNPAVWLRLVRSNDAFGAYYSTSITTPAAASWILLGWHNGGGISHSAYAGLMVCARDNTRLANAAFSSVNIAPPTPPAISPVPDQVINENTSTPVLFVTITDALVTGNNLVLTAISANTNLVPNANIVLGGSGNARTIQITPAPYQSGTATISLIADNGQPNANRATNFFLVTVQTTASGAWRQQFFGTTLNAGRAADGANPAGDGYVNAAKRFLGLNPLTVAPVSALPYPLLTGSNFSVNYTRSLLATDLGWQVQWSPDLALWLTNNVMDVALSTNGTLELRRGIMRTAAPMPLFMRVEVSTP